MAGSEAKTGNPFVGLESNLLIISVDTLAGERMFSRLQDSIGEPYDLVIFDEAHKLSADREPDFSVRKTDRYLLAEALTGMAHDDPRWQRLAGASPSPLADGHSAHGQGLSLLLSMAASSPKCSRPLMPSMTILQMRVGAISSAGQKKKWCASTAVPFTRRASQIH